MEMARSQTRLRGVVTLLFVALANGDNCNENNTVLSFLDDLQRSSEDETDRLMRDPCLMQDCREAKEEICTGKTVTSKAIRREG